MRRPYWVAGAAALVVQVVVTAVLVTNAHRRPAEEPPAEWVSGTPVLTEYGVRVTQQLGRRVLVDRASYAEADALFTGTGVRGRIAALAGTSNTGHLLFHQNIGCDSVSGPQLRVDAAGTYLLTFEHRKHRYECAAHQQVVVAFVHP